MGGGGNGKKWGKVGKSGEKLENSGENLEKWGKLGESDENVGKSGKK